jgi:transposase-like protein
MASRPPRCPTPSCDRARNAEGSWFTRRGTFPRADGRLVRRFQCKACGTHFSDQTFRPDYRQKLPRINAQLRALLASGTSFRAAARLLGVNRKTVLRRTDLAAMARMPSVREAVGPRAGDRSASRRDS